MDFPIIDGIDWDYGRMHFGDDDELLQMTASEYYAMLPESIEKITNSFAGVTTPEGLNTYRIETHSMKSTSALIGAIHLHGLAKTAEYAAKDADYDTIQAITPILLRETRAMIEKLAPVFAAKSDGPRIPVDPAKITALLSMIRFGMSRMDVDMVDARMEQLREFDFDDETEAVVAQLQSATLNLDIARVNELIDILEEQFEG